MPGHAKTEISIWEAIGIAGDILVTVLVLTTVFAVGGIAADRYLYTTPLFTIIGFLILIPIGYAILVKKARRIAKRLQDAGPTERSNPSQQ